jgi:serine phosphatase RsbU (regulator of sigma subunit)
VKTRKNASNILTPSFAFTYIGVIGLVIFLLLRPSFDFNADARFQLSADDAEQRLLQLNKELGIETDTTRLKYMAVRFQDTALLDSLQEQASVPLRPRQLNRAHVPITGWDVIAGQKTAATSFMLDEDDVFRNHGLSRAKLDNRGRVIAFRYKGPQDDLFIPLAGELRHETLENLIQRVFEYDVDTFYHISAEAENNAFNLPPAHREATSANQPRRISGEPSPLSPPDSTGTLVLARLSSASQGPERLELKYEILEKDGQTGLRIHSFDARFLSKPVAENTEGETEVAGSESDNSAQDIAIMNLSIRIIGILLLALIVFSTAIRQIFLGRMEWKRSLFIFVSFTLVLWLLRITYLYPTFYQFITTTIVSLDLIQQFFISGLLGLYGAFAYIAWESLARDFKSGQIPVIDAVWRGHLLKKEVGAGILTGYGIAGFYFGILGVLFFTFDSVMMQADGNFFSFISPSTVMPALHVGLNAWLDSMLFVIAQVALMYNIVALITRSEAFRMICTIVIAGSSFFITSRFFETDATALQVFLIYLALAVPLVLAYRYFGIVSAIMSWFVLLASFKLMPYIGADDSFMQLQAWIILGLIIAPFLLGLLAFIYGSSIRSAKDFIPEYEEALNKRQRSEKELAIAKESQFALLPDKPPAVDGLDISGFFVPSYEVGGDFYDFTLIRKSGESGPVLAFSIADVSGKAMQSAFNAIFTSGLLLSRVETDGPADILTHINPVLCQKTDNKTFITCQTGLLNPRSLLLEWASAGHCPPVLKRGNGCSFLKAEPPKYPLGLRSDAVFNTAKKQLQSHDLLFFYSDGLPEARNPEGERLDFDFILSYLERLETNGKTARQITDEIKAFILNYSNYELADDTTLICIRVL